MRQDDLLFEVVGWAGSLLLIISIVQTRIERLRWLSLIACALLVAYNLWVPSLPMVGVNAALAVINLVNLIRLRGAPNRDAAESLAATSIRKDA
jgi:hypothetical protein